MPKSSPGGRRIDSRSISERSILSRAAVARISSIDIVSAIVELSCYRFWCVLLPVGVECPYEIEFVKDSQSLSSDGVKAESILGFLLWYVILGRFWATIIAVSILSFSGAQLRI